MANTLSDFFPAIFTPGYNYTHFITFKVACKSCQQHSNGLQVNTKSMGNTVHKQEPPPNPVYRTQIHGHKCSRLVHNDVNDRDSKQKPGCGQPGAGRSIVRTLPAFSTSMKSGESEQSPCVKIPCVKTINKPLNIKVLKCPKTGTHASVRVS